MTTPVNNTRVPVRVIPGNGESMALERWSPRIWIINTLLSMAFVLAVYGALLET